MVGNKIAAAGTHAEVVNKRNVMSASVVRYVKMVTIIIANTFSGDYF